jgi:ABC-type thiamine transport system ATPase subunit
VSAELDQRLPKVLSGGQAALSRVTVAEQVIRWVLLIGFGSVLAIEGFLLWQAWHQLV